MGKWTYTWYIQYYTSGNFLEHTYIEARSRQEAIKKLREAKQVVEIYRCYKTGY